MKYEKPALTFKEQANLLISRGMEGERASIERRLAAVNYYRLSGYWFHRKLIDDSFQPGTKFDIAWRQYIFDRRLRLLAMDAIERVEVAVRSRFSYRHAHNCKPFGFAEDVTALPKARTGQRENILAKIRTEVSRSREEFIKHFQNQYGADHDFPPIWITCEVLSFGTVVRLLKFSPTIVQKEVADSFGVSSRVLLSWLWSLNEVRNICAHHCRLWNRELGLKPLIPREKHNPRWHDPVKIENNRVFAVLSICAFILSSIAPSSQWQIRVLKLLESKPKSELPGMGVPHNWIQSPLWAKAAAENYRS